MAGLRTHYKKKAAGFGNLEESRIIKSFEKENARKLRRLDAYNVNRKIIGADGPKNQIVQEDRRMKLLRWRVKRDLQKKIQKAMKPPVLCVGVCHDKLNSSMFLHQSLSAFKPIKSTMSPRITRATAKRLASEACMKARSPDATIILRNKKIITKVLDQGIVHKASKSIEIINIPGSSFAPENYAFRPPACLPSLHLLDQAALKQPKKDLYTTVTPKFCSPCILYARKKKALRQKLL
ncbi:uncharacterized protein LOC124295468 isoform X2 [Neodiprion lecontei]|uniref:Uncharacterized protein LOC124295468 isoform X2 n=1 Tax=Neodiprion lecontei TaxID=441921 RepID=A0ABM3GMK6_NEOLC|nr:uncharacterized protein LOC124295468 isoform X2 [Neodiprion lecontei]